MDKIKVLIVPSSDDEKSYDQCNTFDEAIRESRRNSDDSSSLHEFDSVKEAEIFLMGYKAGIGYLGNGDYYSSEKLNVE